MTVASLFCFLSASLRAHLPSSSNQNRIPRLRHDTQEIREIQKEGGGEVAAEAMEVKKRKKENRRIDDDAGRRTRRSKEKKNPIDLFSSLDLNLEQKKSTPGRHLRVVFRHPRPTRLGFRGRDLPGEAHLASGLPSRSPLVHDADAFGSLRDRSAHLLVDFQFPRRPVVPFLVREVCALGSRCVHAESGGWGRRGDRGLAERGSEGGSAGLEGKGAAVVFFFFECERERRKRGEAGGGRQASRAALGVRGGGEREQGEGEGRGS